jgi:hypothetical protein
MDAQPTCRCPLAPPWRWPLPPPACRRRIVPGSNVGNVGTRARIPIFLSLLFHSPGAAAHICPARARPNIANITTCARAEPRRATTAIRAARGGRPSAPKAARCVTAMSSTPPSSPTWSGSSEAGMTDVPPLQPGTQPGATCRAAPGSGTSHPSHLAQVAQLARTWRKVARNAPVRRVTVPLSLVPEPGATWPPTGDPAASPSPLPAAEHPEGNTPRHATAAVREEAP